MAETRRRIVAAAVACDYAALGALARTGTEDFTFRFRLGEDPAAYWRELEEKKRAPALATLVRVLSLPHAQERGVYIWPSAHREKPTPADWQALEGLYSAEEIQMFREEQEPGCVLALRAGVGILASGEWLYGTSGH